MKQKEIYVLAAPGLSVPREDHPRLHIKDAGDPVKVLESHYYTRRIADGELVVKPAPSTAKTAEKGGK